MEILKTVQILKKLRKLNKLTDGIEKKVSVDSGRCVILKNLILIKMTKIAKDYLDLKNVNKNIFYKYMYII